MSDINWVIKKFEELTPSELYAIMQLRNEVFVVEQNCVYQDADNKDALSFHLMGWSKKKPLRLYPHYPTRHCIHRSFHWPCSYFAFYKKNRYWS